MSLLFFFPPLGGTVEVMWCLSKLLGSTWHRSEAKVQMRWNSETACQNKHDLEQLPHILYHFYIVKSSNEGLYCGPKLSLVC